MRKNIANTTALLSGIIDNDTESYNIKYRVVNKQFKVK